MKIYESKEEKVVKNIVTSTICNCCGKSENATKDGFDFSDITPIDISFQYGSKYDTEIWEFDLCDECVEQITSTFKFVPDKIGVVY